VEVRHIDVDGADLTPLPPEIRSELRKRYEARQQAEIRLVDYLMGVLHARSIPLERYVGFDDETGDIMLAPEEVAVAD
jgi:hypothetical protein